MAKRARTVVAPGKAGQAKKAYSAPTLRRYGALAKLTQSGSAATTEMGTGMMRPSSRRVKQDLVRIGEHPAGFGIYLFRYKPRWRARWGAERQLGVIAEEVDAILPAAVMTGMDGVKRVDYAMLGIEPWV